MKAQKLVSLDVELIEMLKAEDNASELINRLLISHYKYDNGNKHKLYQEVKTVTGQITNLMEKREQMEMKIKDMENADKIEIKQKEKEKKEYEDKVRQFRENFWDNFETFGNRKPTEEEFNEFRELWDSGVKVNVAGFAREKCGLDEM